MEGGEPLDLERIFSNPFYCLNGWQEAPQHEPIVSEELWVKAGANLIKEIGAEAYLRHLLENLKGNFV